MTNQAKSPSTDASAEPSGEPNVILMKRNELYAALLPLAFVTGIAVGFLFWGRQNSNNVVAAEAKPPTAQPTSAAAQEPTRFDIDVDDDPAIGPENAPITIVEFSDFACGYCRRFHEQTFEALLEEYPDQIRFVYRDLPVVGGYEAAQAAECANEQGEYWKFHDLLFSGGLGLDESAYRKYAEIIGIDADSLIECVKEERYAEEVEEDAQYAFNLGANGTPTFFINGIPLVGARPLSDFEAIIENELENGSQQ
jgi:protein-disulfide isomerase